MYYFCIYEVEIYHSCVLFMLNVSIG